MDQGEELKPQQNFKQLRWRKIKITLVAMAAVAILAGGGLSAYLIFAPKTDPIPKKISESVTYPLYYPTSLPKGYSIDQKSFQTTGSVVFYNITAPSKPTLAVAIQAVPSDFNFDDFTQRQMTGSREILTPTGPAVLGQFAGKKVASIVINKTWLLINAPDQFSAKNLENIAKSLKSTSED